MKRGVILEGMWPNQGVAALVRVNHREVIGAPTLVDGYCCSC